MKDFQENSITQAVLAAVKSAPDKRVRDISTALVRHLHAFIREVEPTEVEWERGIAFLTKTGHTCSETRQEFILLSDTLGVSMLVDAINHRFLGAVTPSTVFGPFYVDAPEFPNGSDVSGHYEGIPLYIGGTVHSESGEPLAQARVDVWHSDHEGYYDLQLLDQNKGLAGRGRFTTTDQGAFHLWTMRPCAYPIPNDGPVGQMLEAQGRHPYRPEHVHFMIQADGYRKLVTHIFAEGDTYLDSDVVFGVKADLIRRFEEHDGGIAPDGNAMTGRWFSLVHDFTLAPAIKA